MIQPSITDPPRQNLGAGDLAALCAGARQTLIVAHHPLAALCGLIRSGCAAAATARPGEMPANPDFDALLIPHGDDVGGPDALVRLATKVLCGAGTVVIADLDTRQAAALRRRLRLNGFVPRTVAGGVLCATRREAVR